MINSMEQFFSIIIPFLFIIITSLISQSTANYNLPYKYFINCGSPSAIVFSGRNFTADRSSGDFTFSSGTETAVEKPISTATHPLYQTARIFTKKTSWYDLNILENGTYIVKFHFYPFQNLPNAKFSIIASGFSLLSNFSLQNVTFNEFPVIEEFMLVIPQGKFRVNFVLSENNSFAFVNAMEVFLAPPNTIPNVLDVDGPLRVIHRINVGGEKITPDNDTLLRNWVPDDGFLLNRGGVRDSHTYGRQPSYGDGMLYGVASMSDAPDFVYRTAKELNVGNDSRGGNVSWRFDVNRGGRYFVRTHFCDIVSSGQNQWLSFNLLIDGYGYVVSPYNDSDFQTGAAPFYMDFSVDLNDSGYMNVGIGSRSDSDERIAFLNGIEIMEIVTDRGEAPNGSDSTRKRLFIIVGLSVGGLILVLVILGVFCFVLKRKKWKPVEVFDWPLVPFYGGSSHTRTTDRTSSGSPRIDLNLGLKVPISEILHATKNFDRKLVIGEGGFGKVYKGVLRNKTKVAVKRSEPGHGQGLPEFQTEIMVLSKIRHNHLVSLIGYCDERDEMILIYEFMEKGTLRDHLYILKEESGNSTSRSELSWDQRLKICIGAAKGIHYLHTGSNGAIIHRDIKSTNILLDENYVAKVADFGLSRSGPPDQTHVSTDVKGSFGYLDPEYFRCLQLTQKSDIYSFGVVLLEILCARTVIDHSLPRDQINLADWGMSWQTKGELEKIIDPLLVGKINENSLRKFGETVERCLQEYGADRPNMVDVLWDLEYCLQLQQNVVTREHYEDSTAEMWDLSMPVVERLPSHIIPVGEDEVLDESVNFSGSNQVTTDSEVFSQLKMDEAR